MSFEVNESLKSILQQVSNECTHRQFRNRFEFTQLLCTLNATQSHLVAKFFCNAEWNCGSLSVLQVFQQLRILSATEFILSIKNSDKLELIFNDFLEAEFELITNVFISACYDASNAVSLESILENGLRGLYQDLLRNPTINDLNYLETVTATMPADALSKVTQKHLNIVLELYSSNVREAFRSFSSWINEGVDEIIFTKILSDKLIATNVHDALNYLFKRSTTEHFKEWKFYLILLQTISSRATAETTVFIKKYFKSRLAHIAGMPQKNEMLHLLLSVRAATATTMDIQKNLNAYADWYKQNIGEMKFVMDKEMFQNILKSLDECITYDTEIEYLEVHATISISPPILCGKLVQSYKNKCKSHLMKIRNKQSTPMNLDESICIEDSD